MLQFSWWEKKKFNHSTTILNKNWQHWPWLLKRVSWHTPPAERTQHQRVSGVDGLRHEAGSGWTQNRWNVFKLDLLWMLTLFKKRFNPSCSSAYDTQTKKVPIDWLSSCGHEGQSRMNLGSHKCFHNPHYCCIPSIVSARMCERLF